MKPEEFLQLILSGINPNTGEILTKSSPLMSEELHKEINLFLKNNRYDLKIITEHDKDVIESSELFEKFRQKRLDLSLELGWKPYHVLSNNALVRLIIYEPRNVDEASKIKYIGNTNIKYVPPFLEILNRFKKSKSQSEILVTKKYIAPVDTLCIDCKCEIDFNRRMAEPDCKRCLGCQKKYELTHDTRPMVRDLAGTPAEIEKMKQDLRREIINRHK